MKHESVINPIVEEPIEVTILRTEEYEDVPKVVNDANLIYWKCRLKVSSFNSHKKAKELSYQILDLLFSSIDEKDVTTKEHFSKIRNSILFIEGIK